MVEAFYIALNLMTSYLQQIIFSHSPKLPINEELYEELAVAHSALMAAFALEESYDLLLGNYIEVERELLTASVSNAIRNLNNYQDFFELRSTINRRVVNLLTATRLYLDQAPQRLADSAADPTKARGEFKLRTIEHYDKFFNYRFLEALRNHVQHCGLAVHSITNGVERVSEGLAVSVQPYAERRYLAVDGGFKRKILHEMPAKVSLTLAMREYLQCIGDLHMLVRSHIGEHVLKARQLVSDQISRYATENNGETTGLYACKLNPQGEVKSIAMFLDWDNIREKLTLRNSGLTALSRLFVTGRVS